MPLFKTILFSALGYPLSAPRINTLAPTLKRVGQLGTATAMFLLLNGCTTSSHRPTPLSLDQSAQSFYSRSLEDEGLRAFLKENTGRDFAAAKQTTWDFEALTWVAFYYHPSLDLARAQWAAARAALKTASQRPNPSLSLIPGYDTTSQAGITPWLPAVTLDFLFETAGKRSKRSAAQRKAEESARLAIMTAAWKVRSDLRKAVFDFTLLQQRLTNLRAQQDLQQQITDSTEQRFQAGSASAFERSTARLATVKTGAALADVQRQVPTLRNHLASVLGISSAALGDVVIDGTDLSKPLTFSKSDYAELKKKSLQGRADVVDAFATYQSAVSSFELELAKRYPDAHVIPGYQYDQGLNKWTLGFTFEIPLFHPVNNGPIAEAEAKIKQAIAQFELTQDLALASIDDAVVALDAASAQVEQNRKIGQELKSRVVLADQRLRNGGAERSEYLNTQLEDLTGQLAVIDAEGITAAANGQIEDAFQIPFNRMTAVLDDPRAPSRIRTP